MKGILSASFAALTAILVFISCSKIDTTDLGNGLIPEIDNVHTFDTTISVTSDNFFSAEDNVKMIYNQLHGAGIIENDAEFGKTSSFFYTSFAPSTSHSYPFIKRDTVRIDSVVLSLAYSSVYGDSLSSQQFEVREIDPIYRTFIDSTFRISHDDLPVRPTVIGARNVSFYQLNDSLFYKNARDTIRAVNELRIKLDTSWARRFVAYDTTAQDAYNSDSSFLEKFRGLEIRASEASAQKKAIAYFNLTDNDHTRITFYCRIQNNGRTDTIAPTFIYKTAMPQANLVRRTPSGNYLANINNGLPNDQQIYIQATPGSYALVTIPGLINIPNAVIHRAELIVEKIPSSEDLTYLPPATMFIEEKSGDTALTIRSDFVLANSTTGYDLASLGGEYKNNRYVFNLTRYVQGVLTKGYTPFPLKVYSPFLTKPYFVTATNARVDSVVSLIVNPRIAGGRVVLAGGGYPDAAKAMRLRIIYSKI